MKVAYLAENLGTVDRAWAKGADGLMHHTGHNIGNLAFWYASRLLFDAEIHLVGRNTRAAEVPRDVRAFVIPAANFINSGADLSQLAELVRGLDVPCFVFGLGAQAESENEPPVVQQGTRDFLREVSLRTRTICVRGDFSRKVCASLGVENTAVMGCPSVLINPALDLGRAIRSRISKIDPDGALAIHAACIKSSVYSVERELARLVRLNPGSIYVVQRPVELIKAAWGEDLDEEETLALQKASAFLGFGQHPRRLTQFLRAHMVAPDSIDGWIHHLRRFTAAVNTRIHGTLMSVAAGIPGVCIWHDTRTRELSERLRLPRISVRDFTTHRHNLAEVFANSGFDAEAFDEGRREIAATYAGLLRDAGLTPSRHLQGFLGEARPLAAAA